MVLWKPEPPQETSLDPKTSLFGLAVLGQDLSLTSKEVAVATTLNKTHYLVLVKNPATITVPKAVNNKGRSYIVKNMSKAGVVDIIVANGGTIDWAKRLRLTLQGSFVHFTSEASEWLIIGGINVKLEEILDTKLSEMIELQQKTLTAVRVTNRHQEEGTEKRFDERDIALETTEKITKRYL